MHATNIIELNEIKANFSDVYNLEDPREYFRHLSINDYIIPHVARDIFLQLVASRRSHGHKPITIVDLGCSYGLNAALLKHHVTWDQMVARYTLPEMMRLPSFVLRRLDRLFLASWPRREGLRILGIDIAGRAISYGEAIGALDLGFAVDLEREAPSARLMAELSEAELVVSTGCVGYITNRSFRHLAEAAIRSNGKMWIASFVLRAVDYQPVADELAKAGLFTEKLEGITFVQRRFADVEEMEATMNILKARGIDPSFREERGLMHAEFYLSRPRAAVELTPLEKLVTVATGGNKPHQISTETLSGTFVKGGPGL
jgi:SAM-dependent methyltransferase